MTDADKVRFLANLAEVCMAGDKPDYPNSLDAIARDLLPILREKGWDHAMDWDVFKRQYLFRIWKSGDPFAMPSGYDKNPEPARAAFEAIFEALHGGEE